MGKLNDRRKRGAVRMQRGRDRHHSLLAALSSLALLIRPVFAQNNLYNVNAGLCPGPSGLRGYTSIDLLQTDINNERQLVLNGGVRFPNYQFVLCPDQSYTVTEPLVPALDNILISCGLINPPPEIPDNNCIFEGGETQIEIESFEDSTFPVEFVQIQGITHSNFNDAAIAGAATSDTEAFFSFTNFRNFDSTNIVRQQNENGDPFSAVFFYADVSDGKTSAEGFLNENGSLTIEEMNVDRMETSKDDGGVSSEANSFIAANGDNAVVFVRPNPDESNGVAMSITGSEMFRVINFNDGADGIINGLNVTSMEYINRILKARGLGTTVRLRNSTITRNEFLANAQTVWRAIESTDESQIRLDFIEFDDNNNLEHLIAADGAGNITANGLNILNTAGRLGVAGQLPSSVFFSGDQSAMIVRDTTIEGASQVASILFVYDNSVLESIRNCLTQSDALAAVFVQDDRSSITVKEDNAIEASVTTSVCQTEFDRLVTGQIGCFNASGGDCDPTCSQFAEFADCDEIPLVEDSVSPTTGPDTSSPSTAPSLSTPTSLGSDSPSTVPTNSASPTRSPSPTTSTRSPTTSPTTGRPSLSPSRIPSREPSVSPSFSPSSLPSVIPTGFPTLSSSPTTATRSPTLSPTTDKPSAGPTEEARPTAAPTGAPTVSTSRSPSLAPTTSSPTTLSPTSSPTIAPTFKFSTPAPTRCRPRPPTSKGKGKGVIVSKGGKGKGKGWRDRNLWGEDNGEYYVYQWVYVAKPVEDLPFCDETPRPAPSPHGMLPPYLKDRGYFTPVSRGKGLYYPPSKGTQGYFPPAAKGKGGTKSTKSQKRRNLEERSDFGHERRQKYLRLL